MAESGRQAGDREIGRFPPISSDPAFLPCCFPRYGVKEISACVPVSVCQNRHLNRPKVVLGPHHLHPPREGALGQPMGGVEVQGGAPGV